MVLCEECDSFESIYKCDECDQILCEECDKRIHNKGKRTKHIRRLITTDKSIKVLWDYQTHPDQDLAYTLKSLQDHCKELGGQAQVYCYSHQPIYYQGLATIKVSNEESIQKRIVYEICRQQGDISLLYSFCQEQSKLTLIEYIRKSKAKVFILTALSVKPFQLIDSPSLQSTPPKIQQIMIQQTTNIPSHETQNYQHPRFHSAGVQGFQMGENQLQSYNKYNKQNFDLIPQKQHEKPTSNKQIQELQKLMFQLASQGDLMIEQNRLLQYIIEKIG